MKLHFITNHESCFLSPMFSLCSKYILHLITCSAASLDWPPQSFFFFFLDNCSSLSVLLCTSNTPPPECLCSTWQYKSASFTFLLNASKDCSWHLVKVSKSLYFFFSHCLLSLVLCSLFWYYIPLCFLKTLIMLLSLGPALAVHIAKSTPFLLIYGAFSSHPF